MLKMQGLWFPSCKIYGFPSFFERFLGEIGIFKRNRLISTGAVVAAGCPPTSISGVRPYAQEAGPLADPGFGKGNWGVCAVKCEELKQSVFKCMHITIFPSLCDYVIMFMLSFFFLLLFFLFVCFTRYLVFRIAVLPHRPGVVYYHLL